MFAVAIMLVICGQAMAQTRGAMFLGASFPMKDFAEFNGFDEFALGNVLPVSIDVNDCDAGAAIGFNAGLKWYFNVGVKGLGVMLSVDGFYNGPNAELKGAYREEESSYNGQLIESSFNYKAKPQYINVPAMLGLNYMYRINPNLAVYVEAGAGGNMRFITNMEGVEKAAIGGIKTQRTTIQEYDKAFSFAYQAGLGIEVAKNLVIGCSFYDLGAAAVAGDQTIKTKTTSGDSSTTNTDNSYREMGTVHPIMVLGRIGFSF